MEVAKETINKRKVNEETVENSIPEVSQKFNLKTRRLKFKLTSLKMKLPRPPQDRVSNL